LPETLTEDLHVNMECFEVKPPKTLLKNNWSLAIRTARAVSHNRNGPHLVAPTAAPKPNQFRAEYSYFCSTIEFEAATKIQFLAARLSIL
jgi:hypothetical protein